MKNKIKPLNLISRQSHQIVQFFFIVDERISKIIIKVEYLVLMAKFYLTTVILTGRLATARL